MPAVRRHEFEQRFPTAVRIELVGVLDDQPVVTFDNRPIEAVVAGVLLGLEVGTDHLDLATHAF